MNQKIEYHHLPDFIRKLPTYRWRRIDADGILSTEATEKYETHLLPKEQWCCDRATD